MIAASVSTSRIGLCATIDSRITKIESTTDTVLGRVEGLGDLSHASAVFGRDGRHAFLFGRDGGLSKIDLLARSLAGSGLPHPICVDLARAAIAEGDVAGAPWLAHKAMHEGVLVVEKIAGVKGVHPLDTRNIPSGSESRAR